jgi:hypothetical protein
MEPTIFSMNIDVILPVVITNLLMILALAFFLRERLQA